MFARKLFIAISAAAAFIVLGLLEASADEEALMKAAQAALCGPGIKDLHVSGHDFNVKPASVEETSSGEVFKVRGQISHRLALRPDDQIHYTIDYKDGLPYKAEAQIERGGVLAGLFSLPELLGLVPNIEFFHSEISAESLRQLNADLVSMFGGGKWESQLGAMITFIGATGAAQPRDETCSLLGRAIEGGTPGPRGGLGGSDRPPIHQN